MVPFFKSHQEEGGTQGVFEQNTAYGIKKKKCTHPARFQFAIWGQLEALTLRDHLLLFLRGEGLSTQGTPRPSPWLGLGSLWPSAQWYEEQGQVHPGGDAAAES